MVKNMTTLQDYAASEFYDLKQNFSGQDYVLGKEIESWIKELPYGASKPTIYTITLQGAVAENATSISVRSSVNNIKLYRRDVLKFGSTLVVIAEDTIISSTANTTVPILPAINAIALTNNTITVETAIVEDDIEASLIATSPIALPAGTILTFTSGTIQLDEAITINTTATTVQIERADVGIADNETYVLATSAKTYAMIPILSMSEGGLAEMSGTDAEAMNKEQGLYTARRTVKRDGSITISGGMLRNDPSLKLLQDIGKGSRNIYYQGRYSPFITSADGQYTEGAGPGAQEVVVTLTNNSYPAGGQEFVQVNYTMNFAGRPDQYAPLV